jgi:hypothetical protein
MNVIADFINNHKVHSNQIDSIKGIINLLLLILKQEEERSYLYSQSNKKHYIAYIQSILETIITIS